jgi:two-component system cell cycle sensor histidine kinase/response regulator CckA
MVKTKVLVVEDEAIVARDIQVALEGLGYDVPAVAYSGDEAIEKAEQTHPDLALMDIVLPGSIDGIEAAEQIWSRFDIPVVFVTAYADDETLRRTKATELCGYILKPFEDRELHVNIQMALFKHDKDNKLRERENRYRELAKSLPQTVFEVDQTGTLTFASRQASEVFGYTKQDFAKGLNAIQMIAASDRDRAKQDIARCLQEQRPVIAEYTALRKNRSKFPVLVYLTPILRQNERTGFRGIAIDITERKQAEEALRALAAQAEKTTAIRTLAGGVAHELNNPMMGILNFAQYCLKYTDRDDRRYPVLEDIVTETKRCADIVQDLLTFSHVGNQEREKAQRGSLDF